MVGEYLRSLRDGGLSFKTHHAEWLSKSGVNPHGAIARQHFSMCTGLRLMQTWDQYDVTMSAGTEYYVRSLVQLEAAVRRNPKVPDFSGLEAMMEAHFDLSGAATTDRFNQWVMEQQRTQAQISKQSRLLREEAEHDRNKEHSKPQKGAGRGSGPPPDS